jgi:hypothetical protein
MSVGKYEGTKKRQLPCYPFSLVLCQTRAFLIEFFSYRACYHQSDTRSGALLRSKKNSLV